VLLEAASDQLAGAGHVLDHALPRCVGVVTLDRRQDRLVLCDVVLEEALVLAA
jgi:hypothetical protein